MFLMYFKNYGAFQKFLKVKVGYQISGKNSNNKTVFVDKNTCRKKSAVMGVRSRSSELRELKDAEKTFETFWE